MQKTKRILTIGTIVAVMVAFVFVLANSANAVTTTEAEGAAPDSSNRIPGQFLTGPNEGAALDIALAYINNNVADLGLTAADINGMVVRDQYTSAHNGVTHIYFNQMLDGIQVFNAILNINIARDGSVINVGNRFVPDLANNIAANSAEISAPEAVAAVAGQLGLDLAAQPAVLDTVGGPAQKVLLDNAGISLEAIPAQLMYTPTDNGVFLTWDMTIYELSTEHWWTIRADAATGQILSQLDYVIHENLGEEGGHESHSIAGGSLEGAPQAQSGSAGPTESVPESYRVFAYPLEDPDDGPDTLELNPFDISSNPWGWHDTNGAAGPEFTITRGNNVYADSDLDANNIPDGNAPDAGAPLVFDYAFNLNADPSEYLTGTIVNLFYWNNILHDINYRYGFDEISGNFQENNYGNGGSGSDSVNADAQDGSGTNNANFATPPDGANPRMQMFRTTYPFGQAVTVTAPITLTGLYTANPSNNGGTAMGITAEVVLAVDATPPINNACETITNNLTGKIALIIWEQGACNSSVFVQNVANAGAVAAIMIDNTPLPLTNFGGSPSIPSVAIGSDDGAAFLAALNNHTVTATIGDHPVPGFDRDTDLDNGVIAHEYGHGVSNRLTGGPSTTACLGNQEQMGEGWSDLQTLFINADPADQPTDAREIGVWSLGAGFGGIRNFPYSTDMTINPETYDSIMTTNLPHGLGSVWVAMVWEVYWNLVDKHGFNANIYDDWTTGGNNLTYQLVMDGMKLQPCSPGFVDGRDAILAADTALTGGANQCEIWEGFAKRGLGFSADQGTSFSVTDGTEAFDLPPICSADVALNGSGPASVLEGENITYTFEISNAGALSATNVAFTATLDTDTNYVSASPTTGSCNEAGGVVTCDLGQMDPADEATVTIVVASTVPGDVTATAEVSADQNEDPSNNSASVTTTVETDQYLIYLPVVLKP